MQGRLGELEGHLRANFLTDLKVNWVMWIPAQAINFRFVPPQLQVRAVVACALADLFGGRA